MSSQRRSIRVAVETPCRVLVEDHDFTALVMDLSVSGARIDLDYTVSPDMFQVGQTCHIEISTTHEHVRTAAEVRRIIPGRVLGIGVEFSNDGGQKHEFLNSLIQSLLSNAQLEGQTIKTLGTLIASTTHDLKTPLSIMRLVSSKLGPLTERITTALNEKSLSRSDLDNYLEKIREGWELIETNTDRAVGLVDSFKNISSDQATMDRRTFDVKKYLEDIVVSVRPKTEKSGHRIELRCSQHVMMDSYPGSFARVITNLIMNCFVHGLQDSPAGEGRLVIELKSTQPSSLSIELTDNGKGIPEEHLEKIFTPFFTTKKDSGGTGLGLSIVKKIVEEGFGGTIECASKLGSGTTFTLNLPLSSP